MLCNYAGCDMCEQTLRWQYAGPFDEAPINISYSPDFACRELSRIESEQAPGSGYFDAMAHDVWGLGYLLCWLLARVTYFTPPENTWEAVCIKHEEWVSHPCLLLELAACRCYLYCMSTIPLHKLQLAARMK